MNKNYNSTIQSHCTLCRYRCALLIETSKNRMNSERINSQTNTKHWNKSPTEQKEGSESRKKSVLSGTSFLKFRTHKMTFRHISSHFVSACMLRESRRLGRPGIARVTYWKKKWVPGPKNTFNKYSFNNYSPKWLITSELANQRAGKVLFTCVVYTNKRYYLWFKADMEDSLSLIPW